MLGPTTSQWIIISKIYDHVKEDDEIMFVEIGWPAPEEEHYAKQENFIIS
jgi:hypothetical protein